MNGQTFEPLLDNNSGICSGNGPAAHTFIYDTDADHIFEVNILLSRSNMQIADVASSVPEPTTWAMMLLGFAGSAS
jgi:hypothetical protein